MNLYLRISWNLDYLITENINQPRGLCNGMIVSIREVRLKDGTIPQWNTDMRVHIIGAERVEAIIVKYNHGNWGNKTCFDTLGVGCGILQPFEKKISCMLGEKRLKVQMKQFYLAPASSITGHKSQGQTLPKIAISCVRNRKGVSDKGSWLYVALSRAKKLMDVSLTFELAKSDFSPRFDLQFELLR